MTVIVSLLFAWSTYAADFCMRFLKAPQPVKGYAIGSFLDSDGLSIDILGARASDKKLVRIQLASQLDGNVPDMPLRDRTETHSGAVIHMNGTVREAQLTGAQKEVHLRDRGARITGARSVHLPNLLAVGSFEGSPVLITSFEYGESLRDLIDRREELDIVIFLDLARELIRLRNEKRLSHHGNLSPENIRLLQRGARVVPVMFNPASSSATLEGVTTWTNPHYNPSSLRNSRGDAVALALILIESILGGVPDLEELSDFDYFADVTNEDRRNLGRLMVQVVLDPETTLERFEEALITYLRS